MRVFISADIEGITGVVSWSQAEGPTAAAYDFAFARRMYTHDVNAAIRGARAAGAGRIVIIDAHNKGKNLLVDELEPGTELISGYGSGTLGMMLGIEEGFDAAMLVGYHGMAGTTKGLLEHALNGGLHRCWLNGREMGEIGVNAAIAGAFDTPVCLVTSDVAGCREASAALPGVETYATKEACGRFMARLKHPSETGPGIESAAKRAIERAGEIAPQRIEGPATFRVEFHTSEQVDLACTMEQATRLDGYTIEFTRPSLLEAVRALYVSFNLAIAARTSRD